MKFLIRLFFVGALFSICSWGFLVHRTINQLAVYRLPDPLQGFFYQQMDYLVKNSVRADQRRNEDSTEATKHFIDLEAFGQHALSEMPRNWNAAVARYTKDSLLKYGYVPYYVVFMEENLTRAFRNRQRDSIVFYAADLAHYISDAHVPLHTTINYDGQLTDQKGLHALWETVVPELELANYELGEEGAAQYVKDKPAAIWAAVEKAYNQLPAVFGEEKEATKQFTDATKFRIQVRNGREVKYFTTAFALEYSKRMGTSINDQLKASARMVADFWYTAWVDAGKPDLQELYTKPLTAEEKANLEEDKAAYRSNQLIRQNRLISKMNTNSN